MKAKKGIMKKLFISNLCLSAFTFGGGYVIVSLMKKKFVDELKWIGEDEMLDLVAIAQSGPGAVAINGAIVVGYKLAGLWGVLVSILATVIPPFIIISLISFFYAAFRDSFLVSELLKGMQAGVAAVIAGVVFDMGSGIVKKHDPLSLIIMAGAFIASCILKINVVYIILSCALLGLLRYYAGKGRRGK